MTSSLLLKCRFFRYHRGNRLKVSLRPSPQLSTSFLCPGGQIRKYLVSGLWCVIETNTKLNIWKEKHRQEDIDGKGRASR